MNTKSWIFKTLSSALLAGIALVLVTNAEAVSFDYSSTPGSSIIFPGDGTITFAPGVDNFKVTSGTASGFLGEITGIYTIGAITTVGPLSTAPVTGTGTFTISDGTFDLTASLQWFDIQQIGIGGSLNILGGLNMTGITYGGTNPDLLALANAGSALNVFSFQFNPAVSLLGLKNGPGPNQTSFSGSIATVPDGGSTLGLLGLAFLGIAVIHRRTKLFSA